MRNISEMFKTLQNRRGFTLIELIVTIAVLSVFTYLIAMLIQNSMGFFKDEESQVANQAALRIVAVQFEKDIRRYVIGVDEFVSSGNCYTIDPIFDEVEGVSSDIDYCLVGNTIERNGIVIARGVSVFTASYGSDNSILLTIQSFADNYNRENKVVVRIFVRVGS